MANKSKIIGDIEVKIRELCEKGYNATHISKEVGLSKDTVKVWAAKNGFLLSKRMSSKILDLEPKIIELLKNGKSRKQIQIELNVHYTQVTQIAYTHGIAIRNQREAALDKILSIEEANGRLPNNNGKVIGYNQKSNKYIIQAEDGFIYYKTSAKIKQGDPRNKSGTPLTIENVKEQLNKLGYEYVKGWTIKRSPFMARHLKCGQLRETRLTNFYSQECGTCSNNGTSKSEIELSEWVKQYYPSTHKYKFQERVTRPKEIDIYVPELKLGIEYCGLYYHSENIASKNADSNKHYKKMLSANKEGIRLITIFANEWTERKDQIKGFLLSALQKNEITIYGRDCSTQEISIELASEFFEKYHIQGNSSIPTICFGIFYNNELVGAMNGGQHPRKPKKDGVLYLNRMAFKTGMTVVGGSSKLFKSLIEYAKSRNYTKIISWSDNRWSEGNVYNKLGFTFDSQKLKGRGLEDGSIWPDFYYVMRGKLVSRQAIKKLKYVDIEEIPKVYDCGKKRWIINL